MRIGSLFSGYGGLDMAVANVTGATTAWVSDIDKGACKILAHRHPEIPNLRDITTIDWSQVEPVDILTGGFPCQDVSHAGKRAGIRPDTRSGLWTQMAYAIEQLHPRLVVIENVRGLLSANAHSDLEPCPWCLGDRSSESALRALGAVLGGLAELGYDAIWQGLRAADVGAPHGRFRVFIVAHAADADDGRRWEHHPRLGRVPIADPDRRAALMPTPRATDGTKGGPNQRGSSGDLMLPSAVLLPTPTAQDGANNGGPSQFDRNTLPLNAEVLLLPTPNEFHMGNTETPEEWLERRADVQERTGTRHGPALPVVAQLIADGAPLVQDGDGPRRVPAIGADRRFGVYAPAIARWEHALGRPAPAPTEPTGRDNAPRLSPAFVEWMMGLPAGWVTDVPEITRNEALKACGNGVVPQQAEAALRYMLAASQAVA